MLLVTAIACNALLFSMFGVTNTVAFAIFSPLFGFFSGACASTSPYTHLTASMLTGMCT